MIITFFGGLLRNNIIKSIFYLHEEEKSDNVQIKFISD